MTTAADMLAAFEHIHGGFFGCCVAANFLSGYPSGATETTVAGIGVLDSERRSAALPCGFFVALVRPFMGDRARGARKGSPVALTGTPTLVRSPAQIGVWKGG